MNFAELKTELYARGTDYLSEDAAGVARAERWLNQGYREILNLHAWPFLVDTASGTDGTVSVPTLRRVIGVTADGVPLEKATWAELVIDDFFDLTETGVPEFWYLDAGLIKSYPVGTNLSVRFIKRVEPMTGTDTPIFDEEYHNLIVDKAMIKAYQDNDNFEAAAALQQSLDAGLAAMAEDYLLDARAVSFIQIMDPQDG